MIEDLYKKLSLEDSYHIALMILYFLKDEPKMSTISELSYILDRENFTDFIKYYEGQTIQIPSSEDISRALKSILLYQYRVIYNMDWDEAAKKAGFNSSESGVARGLYIAIQQVLDKCKVGDKLREVLSN